MKLSWYNYDKHYDNCFSWWSVCTSISTTSARRMSPVFPCGSSTNRCYVSTLSINLVMHVFNVQAQLMFTRWTKFSRWLSELQYWGRIIKVFTFLYFSLISHQSGADRKKWNYRYPLSVMTLLISVCSFYQIFHMSFSPFVKTLQVENFLKKYYEEKFK